MSASLLGVLIPFLVGIIVGGGTAMLILDVKEGIFK